MKKLIIATLISLSFSMHRNTGVVKFYNEDKGFGYITDNNTKNELYVYEECLIDEIYNNDVVIYEIRDTRKGLEAFNVKIK